MLGDAATDGSIIRLLTRSVNDLSSRPTVELEGYGTRKSKRVIRFRHLSV